MKGCLVRLMVYNAVVCVLSLIAIIIRLLTHKGLLLWVVWVAVVSFLICLMILLHIVTVVENKKGRY